MAYIRRFRSLIELKRAFAKTPLDPNWIPMDDAIARATVSVRRNYGNLDPIAERWERY